MSLADQLAKDCQVAMKARDSELVGTLRYLLAQVKNQEIAKREVLSDVEVEKVLRREAKKRQESIAAYEKAGRQELVTKEQAELAVIEKYLPQMMNRVEVEQLVSRVIEEIGASSPAEFGRVMGEVMKRSGGRTDGNVVQEVVRAKLG